MGSEREKTGKGNPGKRILVVEDNQSVREFITDTLKDVGGFEVDHAADKRVLALLEEIDYDLFIVDLYLSSPDIHPDGLDLIREIRERKPASRFIVISGKSLSENIEECVNKLGIMDFLAKPIGVKDLIRTVRRVIE